MNKDLRELWDAMPHKGPFLLLLAAWAALFHFLGNSVFGYVDTPSLFGWLWAIWNGNADDEIGMFVPVLVAVLLFLKRGELLAAEKRPWVGGLALVALGLLLHVLGYTVQQTRVSAFGFLLGLGGLAGLAWGPGLLRSAFFPCFLLVFCIPMSAFLEPLTFPLRVFVTKAAVGFCNVILSMNIEREGTMIFNARRSFQFDVAPACSGINSLTAMFLLTVAYGFLHFTTPWRRAVLIAAAIPLAVLGNIGRLVTVIVVGEGISHNAGAAIEQKFGFVTFLFALGGMFALGWWLREKKDRASSPTDIDPDADSTPQAA